jgi:hypothetical protein
MINDWDLWGIIEEVKYFCQSKVRDGNDITLVAIEASKVLDDWVLNHNGDMCDRAVAAYFVVEELYQRYGLDLPLDMEVTYS